MDEVWVYPPQPRHRRKTAVSTWAVWPPQPRRLTAFELSEEDARKFEEWAAEGGKLKAKWKEPEKVQGIPLEELEKLMEAQQKWEQFRTGPHDTWYHVSPHELAEGTQLIPGGPDGKATSQDFYDMGFGDDTGTLKDMGGGRVQHVWLTPDLDDAHFWAASLGAPHIYEVDPDENPQPWNGTGIDGFVTPGAKIRRRIVTGRVAAYDPRKIVWTDEQLDLMAELADRLRRKEESGELPIRDPNSDEYFSDALQEMILMRREKESL